MPKKSDIRTKIGLAREAYILAHDPCVSPIYTMSEKWGTESEQNNDPTVPNVTKERDILRDMGIDYKYIVIQVSAELTRKHGTDRPQRLIDFLKENGTHANYSYWQRKELKHDIKILKNKIVIYSKE